MLSSPCCSFYLSSLSWTSAVASQPYAFVLLFTHYLTFWNVYLSLSHITRRALAKVFSLLNPSLLICQKKIMMKNTLLLIRCTFVEITMWARPDHKGWAWLEDWRGRPGKLGKGDFLCGFPMPVLNNAVRWRVRVRTLSPRASSNSMILAVFRKCKICLRMKLPCRCFWNCIVLASTFAYFITFKQHDEDGK